MKNILLVAILLHLLIHRVIATTYEETNRTITYYVSTNGSDKNSGNFNHPFATLDRAVRAVDIIIKESTGKLPKPIEILFRGGLYHITRGITVTGINPGSEASMKISAYNNENVIFSGGKKIKGKNFRVCKQKSILERLPTESGKKVLVIDLKKEGVLEWGSLKQHGFGTIPEPAPLELFINGTPQTLARYPNIGILKVGKVYDKGSIPRDGDFSNRGPEFGYEYDRPDRWKTRPGYMASREVFLRIQRRPSQN